MGIPCLTYGTQAAANAIVVTQTAVVPTFFAGVLGYNSCDGLGDRDRELEGRLGPAAQRDDHPGHDAVYEHCGRQLLGPGEIESNETRLCDHTGSRFF